jgi:hypothetical protein
MNNKKDLRSKSIFKKKIKNQSENALEDTYKPPKNWKNMYLRSEKLRRAKQLGIEYPRITCASLLKIEF